MGDFASVIGSGPIVGLDDIPNNLDAYYKIVSAHIDLDLSNHTGSNYVDGSGEHYDTEVHGGWNNDTIISGDGDDTLFGGAGEDSIDGHAGDDDIHGDAGADIIHGGKGDDTINGDAGDDSL